MKILMTFLLLGLTSGLSVATADENFLKSVCNLDFPEAMLHLQQAIKKQGYTVSRVQHVDKGLHHRGYESQMYKVVFFGKQEEMERITHEYPQLVPYVPLSITIVQQDKINIISGLRPKRIAAMFESKLPDGYFEQWEKDFAAIFEQYEECNDG